MRFVSKKMVGAMLVAVLVLGGAAAAFAYFTSSGVGNGTGTVGSATTWSVTGFGGSGTPSATGTLYPGVGSASLTYRVTNAGSGHQAVNSVVVTVAADGTGNALDSTGTAITGCLATWFSVGASSFLASDGTTAVSLATPRDLANAGYITGSTAITMANVALVQDACQAKSPRLTVTVA
jgi:hypothetical protein